MKTTKDHKTLAEEFGRAATVANANRFRYRPMLNAKQVEDIELMLRNAAKLAWHYARKYMAEEKLKAMRTCQACGVVAGKPHHDSLANGEIARISRWNGKRLCQLCNEGFRQLASDKPKCFRCGKRISDPEMMQETDGYRHVNYCSVNPIGLKR